MRCAGSIVGGKRNGLIRRGIVGERLGRGSAGRIDARVCCKRARDGASGRRVQAGAETDVGSRTGLAVTIERGGGNPEGSAVAGGEGDVSGSIVGRYQARSLECRVGLDLLVEIGCNVGSIGGRSARGG